MTATEASRSFEISDRSDKTFERMAEPFRGELKLHCYRMMGSLHEAEDLVQDTYLRAWRSFDSFEGRGSLRGWLYQIATNTCLNAIAGRKYRQRFLPDQRFPVTAQMPDGVPASDVDWLEPYPDSELAGILDETLNPEARYASREAVQLAFVAAIQQLPPRQRAALLLCDVLGWGAAEAATLLGGSTASINSVLQRARVTMAKSRNDDERPMISKPAPAQQKLLDRYLKAWEELDLDKFVALLKEDATYTMPPLAQWYVGRQSIRAFFEWAWKDYGGYRLLPTAANGQPAFAAYFRSRTAPDAPWSAHSIHVLSLAQGSISAVTLFVRPAAPALFQAFGLPLVITDTVGTEFSAQAEPP
ncbi:sigma-70 family RNA polymerase sigma factor [Bradyrhizobium sp. B097]|uniref:sigma-70 family RNA polymerase sigma factor n=1 Tax=Bradyrhizobium sp. B097 TaxID=3140244 RepID=UPI0031840C80